MFRRIKNLHFKVIAMILIFIITFSIMQVLFSSLSRVNADSNRYEYNGNNLDDGVYPGFKSLIDELKAKHPAWRFVIMETGLDWNQAIVAESSILSSGSPLSLIQGKVGDWICQSCGTKTYDNGSWYHASEYAIKYYMDARNWLKDNAYILQFLQVGYVETSDENIYNALDGTYLHKMDIARAINNGCKAKGANPYYIVARIIQEQGTGKSATYEMESDGVKYYNLFNIGASGNGNGNIVSGALAYAKSHGWTSVQKSVEGGIDFLFSGYLKNKQDTMYLNKFDVESKNGVYNNQYMQNIEAPTREATLMYNKIKDTEILNQTLTFVIPVFYNMPSERCASPDETSETGAKNIKLRSGHSNYNVREARNQSSKVITTVESPDTIVLSDQRYRDGWHRVVLTNGTAGYIKFNSSIWEEIDDVTNCNEQMSLSGDGVNLRAGPGIGEPIITTLSKGQLVNRIDNSGMYSYNGITWDRVILADGRQGFISRDYLEVASNDSEVYTISANGGLFLRETPAGNAIRLLPNGTTVTRTEIAENELNGNYWDKVTTPEGATGYVARAYLRDSNGNVPSGKRKDNDETTEINVKKDDENKAILMEPNVKVDNLKSLGNKISVKNKNGEEVTKALIGTGYKITIDGKEYTAIKKGDVNGDGEVDVIDLAKIKRELIGKIKLENEYKSAAKLSKSSDKIDVIDLALLKRYLIGTKNIEIK